MTKEMQNLINENENNERFKYMLLDRMKSDCEYFLCFGNQLNKYLWSGDPKDHIEDMRALYNSFPEDKKPEWLTPGQIQEYENLMIFNKCEKQAPCCGCHYMDFCTASK